MQQFWSRGYEHTSMQNLLAAMALSKSSLYQTFGGKQQLFRRCIQRYTDQLATELRQRLTEAPSGWRFIEDFLASVLNDLSNAPRGCLVMNTASELGQGEPGIASQVSQSIGRFREILQEAVARAQREGEIAPERDPRVLAGFLVSSISGLKVQAKAGADRETLVGIIAVTLRALSA